MKTIRIFALPSHQSLERTSGVDFARIIQPARHLNGYKDVDTKFVVHVYDPRKHKTLDWLDVASKHDIIFFNYTAMSWEFAKMGLMARKFNRLLIMDVDDLIWGILPDNPVYEAFKKGSENLHNFTAICNEVDYITTTNKYLRNAISHNTDKSVSEIVVFPNYIDLDNLYTHRSPFKDTADIRLVHFGSTSHFIDLQSEEFARGIDMIMKVYPNVTLKTVGALIPKYKYRWGQRYENSYGHQDLYKWVGERMPGFMDEADIIVTPLDDNIYNRCKSSIKYLEASSAVKPGVWSNIRQYNEAVNHGTNGFLATTASGWYESIKKLIEDKKLRKSMAENAFETVENTHQMKDNIKLYADFFKSVLS